MQLEKEQAAQQVQQQKSIYEDYGTTVPSSFTQRSFSSGTPFQQTPQYSPPPVNSMPVAFTMPVPAVAPVPAAPSQAPSTPSLSEKTFGELDLNDPSTLEIYSRILLFKDDPMRDELAFSRTLTPKQRRIVHLIAQKLGVYHYSVGEGDERYAVVTRIDPQRVSLLFLLGYFVY